MNNLSYLQYPWIYLRDARVTERILARVAKQQEEEVPFLRRGASHWSAPAVREQSELLAAHSQWLSAKFITVVFSTELMLRFVK